MSFEHDKVEAGRARFGQALPWPGWRLSAYGADARPRDDRRRAPAALPRPAAAATRSGPPLPPPPGPLEPLRAFLSQRIIIYPNYLDNRKTVAQGRCIPKELGTRVPGGCCSGALSLCRCAAAAQPCPHLLAPRCSMRVAQRA